MVSLVQKVNSDTLLPQNRPLGPGRKTGNTPAEELQKNADAEARRLEKQRQKRAELSKELAGSRLYTEPRQMQLVAHELRR